MLLLSKIYFLYYAFESQMNIFLVFIKIIELKKHVLICTSCEKKISSNSLLDIILRNCIIHNPSNMKFVSMLNKIKEHLITPHFAFVQNIQLRAYGEYVQKHCKCSNKCKSFTKCIATHVTWWLFYCCVLKWKLKYK
jgi:hypothetical protein